MRRSLARHVVTVALAASAFACLAAVSFWVRSLYVADYLTWFQSSTGGYTVLACSQGHLIVARFWGDAIDNGPRSSFQYERLNPEPLVVPVGRNVGTTTHWTHFGVEYVVNSGLTMTVLVVPLYWPAALAALWPAICLGQWIVRRRVARGAGFPVEAHSQAATASDNSAPTGEGP